jgi:Mg-chelatase subunit ChlI
MFIDITAKEELVKLNRRKAKQEAKRQARIEANSGEEEDDPMNEDDKENEEEEEEEEEEPVDLNSLEADEDDMNEMETVSSRFVEFLLRHLLRGFTAKTSAVRIRSCQIIALSISSMGEIE